MSCSGLYLDFGCNMGVQPRKLLEPERYPGAPVLPLFDHVFGRPGSPTRAAVCVVCVEPNPRHAPSLRRLQQRYAAEGKAFYYFDRAIALTHQTMGSSSENDRAKRHPVGVSLCQRFRRALRCYSRGTDHRSRLDPRQLVAARRLARIRGGCSAHGHEARY